MGDAIKYILERNRINLELSIDGEKILLVPIENTTYKPSVIRAIARSEQLIAYYDLHLEKQSFTHQEVLSYFQNKGWKIHGQHL